MNTRFLKVKVDFSNTFIIIPNGCFFLADKSVLCSPDGFFSLGGLVREHKLQAEKVETVEMTLREWEVVCGSIEQFPEELHDEIAKEANYTGITYTKDGEVLCRRTFRPGENEVIETREGTVEHHTTIHKKDTPSCVVYKQAGGVADYDEIGKIDFSVTFTEDKSLLAAEYSLLDHNVKYTLCYDTDNMDITKKLVIKKEPIQ